MTILKYFLALLFLHIRCIGVMTSGWSSSINITRICERILEDDTTCWAQKVSESSESQNIAKS